MKYIALLLLLFFLFNCSTRRYPSEPENAAETTRLKKELEEKFGKEPWYPGVTNVSVKITAVHIHIKSSLNYENRKAICRAASDFYYANPENRHGTIEMFDDTRRKLLLKRHGITGECR
jgi:hypothetical protein